MVDPIVFVHNAPDPFALSPKVGLMMSLQSLTPLQNDSVKVDGAKLDSKERKEKEPRLMFLPPTQSDLTFALLLIPLRVHLSSSCNTISWSANQNITVSQLNAAKPKTQLLYKLLHMEKFLMKKGWALWDFDRRPESWLTAVFLELFTRGPQPIHNREWILWTVMLQNAPVVWRIEDLSVGRYFLGSVPY